MADDFSHDAGGGRFPETRRSAVVAVASDDPAERARSFEILVRAYWRPVYKYLRLRARKDVEEARDLTQGFFARAFEKRAFASFDPAVARFRTYLKACLDRFVREQARNEKRLKRGGDAVLLSLDFDDAEGELAHAGVGAEEVFDREWVRGLFSAAVDALREGCADAGKGVRFMVFQRYVLDEVADRAERPSYAELAAELSIPVTDVTNHLAFARREFRRLVLARLRELTGSEEEFKSEARAVLGVDP